MDLIPAGGGYELLLVLARKEKAKRIETLCPAKTAAGMSQGRDVVNQGHQRGEWTRNLRIWGSIGALGERIQP